MKIPESEFNLSFSKAGGSGGQNVNKVNTKATLTWPINDSVAISNAHKKRFKDKFSNTINSEGLVKIESQRYRTQKKNISDCIDKLYEYLRSTKSPPKRRIETKPTRSSIKKRIANKKNKGEIKKNRKKVNY